MNPRLKRRLLIILPAGLLAVVAGAALWIWLGPLSLAPDPFDPPDFTPTPAPSDWMTITRDLRPATVKAIAPRKIPATRLELPADLYAWEILPTSDGGCLAIYSIQPDQDQSGSPPLSIIRVIHFKADGTILWDRRYDDHPFRIQNVSACLFADDSFAVGLKAWAGSSADSALTNWLLRFSDDGTLEWQTEESEHPGALEFIFAAGDGSVLAAGTTEVRSGGEADNLRVGLLRFSADGHLAAKNILPSENARLLYDAAYDQATGLVLLLRRSLNGAPGQGPAYVEVSVLGCFTPDLTGKWSVELKQGEYLNQIRILPEQKGIIAIGGAPAVSGANPVNLPKLSHFTAQGVPDWSYSSPNPAAWISLAVSLSDVRYVAGLYSYDDDSGEKTSLLLFPAGAGASGSPVPRELAILPGVVQQLVPTRDGGLTAILRQSVRTLPQPPYVSSIWTDTEAIVVHYSSAMKITWQRKIDLHKHSTQADVIVATVDDRLLVG
jgi:hypothetical protein